MVLCELENTIDQKIFKKRVTNIVKKFKKQVDRTHYEFATYMDKQRWGSLWHQVDEILKVHPNTVLEVGKGTGILGPLLKHYGIYYQSADIDPELEPDYVTSVNDLPFKDNTFDVACCFQVLEHIPYSSFHQSVTELLRVAKKQVVISLPDAKSLWQYSIHVPTKGKIRFDIPRPQFCLPKHVFNGEHYWEINKEGYPLEDVIRLMEKCGCIVNKSYRVIEHPYHHFFVLVKNK